MQIIFDSKLTESELVAEVLCWNVTAAILTDIWIKSLSNTRIQVLELRHLKAVPLEAHYEVLTT